MISNQFYRTRLTLFRVGCRSEKQQSRIHSQDN